MAWIVKDSANIEIDRRAEPYMTDAHKKRFDKQYLVRYPTRQAALLPVCHEMQHEIGWLPAQVLEEIAEYLELSYAEVIDTVSFYEEFHTKPKGKYLIQICRSVACHICGYEALSKKVQDKLDILPGETTDDGKFTLEELECLGACDFAPCALVDEKLKKSLTWEDLEKSIDELPD